MLQVLPLLLAVTIAAQSPTILQVKGTFVEPVSKIAFPERLDEWTRGNVAEYPWPGGYSVSHRLGRGHDAPLADLTAYVYPHVNALMPTRLDQHFALIVETPLGAYPDAELIDTTRESALGLGGPVMRSAALFRSGLAVAGSPDVDAVYLQKEDGFWIKWRSSMPSATMDAVSPRVRALIDALIAAKTSD